MEVKDSAPAIGFAVNMRGAGRLLGVVDIPVAGTVDPEFAHRNIGVLLAEQLVGDGGHADAGSLGSQPHLVLVRVFWITP